jgi:hypothetical protein
MAQEGRPAEHVEALGVHISALLEAASRVTSRDIGALVADREAVRSLTRSRLAFGEGLEEAMRVHQAAEDATPPSRRPAVEWSAEQRSARKRLAEKWAAEVADEARERQQLYGTRLDPFPDADDADEDDQEDAS